MIIPKAPLPLTIQKWPVVTLRPGPLTISMVVVQRLKMFSRAALVSTHSSTHWFYFLILENEQNHTHVSNSPKDFF